MLKLLKKIIVKEKAVQYTPFNAFFSPFSSSSFILLLTYLIHEIANKMAITMPMNPPSISNEITKL